MEKVRVEDAEKFDHPMEQTPGGRRVSEALGATEFAMNYYELEPGEGFSGGMHTHLDQEEVFYVESGTATFETEEGEVEVGSGEAIRFAPGEYQHGFNGSDERVEAVAFGAPADPEETRVPMPCPECGSEGLDVEIVDDSTAVVLTCPECGEETTT